MMQQNPKSARLHQDQLTEIIFVNQQCLLCFNVEHKSIQAAFRLQPSKGLTFDVVPKQSDLQSV